MPEILSTLIYRIHYDAWWWAWSMIVICFNLDYRYYQHQYLQCMMMIVMHVFFVTTGTPYVKISTVCLPLDYGEWGKGLPVYVHTYIFYVKIVLHVPERIYRYKYIYIYINVKILFITNILFYVCPYLAKFLSRSLLQNLRVCRMMSFMFVILDSCPVPEIISLPTDVLEI